MTEKHRTTTTLREAAERFKLAISYATPQREWIGLTDEEVELYWDWEDFQCGCGKGTLIAMVRDIQSRLKEKNT